MSRKRYGNYAEELRGINSIDGRIYWFGGRPLVDSCFSAIEGPPSPTNQCTMGSSSRRWLGARRPSASHGRNILVRPGAGIVGIVDNIGCAAFYEALLDMWRRRYDEDFVWGQTITVWNKHNRNRRC
ncbi:hypothetical protein C7999DRAFT_30001 [Corynascus novoguineensis]|uniref:Uncharacterized protein n=1 Tax=Corynascus novoguineensis TaxID=1126955 RepID=A0AAN7HRM9_9PEZI|nr:hypothetical protein C7999DRAFT_30001 [Corynascus novoguineensis]